MSRVMVDEKFMRNEESVTGALDAVKAMRVVEFTTSGSMGDARQQGVVGQSLTENAPLAVEVDGIGYHYVDHEKLVPLLVAAIQELAAATRVVRKKADASE